MEHPPKITRKKRPLWLPLFAVILLLCAGAALYWKSIPSSGAPSTAAVISEHPVKTVYAVEKDSLTEIRITSVKGEQYSLVRAGDGLELLSEEGSTAINGAYSAEILDLFCNITVQGTVCEDLSEADPEELGLEPPLAKAEIDYMNGDTVLVRMGRTVPESGYSYITISTEPGIYMGDVGFSDLFSLTAAQLLPVEQPVLSGDLCEEIRVTSQDGSFCLQITSDSDGNRNYRLTEPFVYPADPDTAEALTDELNRFYFGSVWKEEAANPVRTVDIHQSEGMSLQEGEDGLFKVETVPGGVFRFNFGETVDEHYTVCEYQGETYLMNRYLISGLCSVTAEDLLSRHPAQCSAEKTQEIHIVGMGTEDTLRVQREARVLPNNEIETGTDGNPVYDRVLTVNGETVSEEWLETLAEKLSQMTAAGSVPDGWKAEGEPKWRVTLTDWDGNKTEILGWKMDAFSDAVSVNGVLLHYVSSEDMESVLLSIQR